MVSGRSIKNTGPRRSNRWRLMLNAPISRIEGPFSTRTRADDRGDMAREPFGARLRSLRERAGMNQTQLAEKAGTDQAHISRWERNLAEPDTGMVQRLAAALRVYAVELLIGHRKPPSGGP